MLASFRTLPVLLLLVGSASADLLTEPAPAPVPVAAPRTLAAQAETLRLDFQTRLSALNEQLKAASTSADRLALQQQIGDLKAAHEIEMLELQLRHAQEFGKSEAAQEIQSALELLRDALLQSQATRSVASPTAAPQR